LFITTWIPAGTFQEHKRLNQRFPTGKHFSLTEDFSNLRENFAKDGKRNALSFNFSASARSDI